MSKLLAIQVLTQGDHINIKMKREYERQFGGGTHQRGLDIHTINPNDRAAQSLRFIFTKLSEMEKSFPEYNPNPEVLDPGHKANLETIERVNTDYDLYP